MVRKLAAVVGGLVLLLASACMKEKPEETSLKKTIKVMFSSESDFNQKYGQYFAAEYPNIEIEVIPMGLVTSEQKWQLIQQQKPDVFFTYMNEFEFLVKNNALVSLEPFLKENSFDLGSLHPGLISALRERGGGQLFALPLTFNSIALIYNKQLFDRYKLEYPRDGMTWTEVMSLAKKFPTDGPEESRVYGLSVGSSYSDNLVELIRYIGQTKGLAYWNAEGDQVTLNTEAWRRIYFEAVELFRSGAIKRTQLSAGVQSANENEFAKGNTAMTLDSYYSVATGLLQASGRAPDQQIKWGIAASPVSDKDGETGIYFASDELTVISAESAQTKEAWAFVQYVNSEEYARIKNQLLPIPPLLARTGSMREFDGNQLDKFAQFKPNSLNYVASDPLKNAFYNVFEKIASGKLDEVLAGKLTVEEAVEQLQVLGQEELMKVRSAAAEKK
ncbi:ABC transporter substrate-binding protein [Cohnella faecalis]|uniref:Carbohydrate ABC transporter substrate-binding protein n=1 Tax=Cohnella faecalis TaxID=2315694 RepID=A0A398CRP8_9BACL|nr:ABC transporter substrate-binding protein [Cohnella faecalis]RIE05232.1 carbohydrate ABC transporter substrate-binding protein [Cohnella faecalis]